MSARTPLARAFAVTFGVALLAMTTGCTQALNSGLAIVGIDRDESSNPFGNSSRAESHRQFTSTYQHTPTLDLWTGVSIGRHYSVASSLSISLRGQSPSGLQNCQVFPMGLARVLPIDNGVSGTPLHDSGGVHIGIAGNLAPSSTLLAGDGLGFARQALSASSRMGTAGNECGQSLFMYVQLGSSPGTPVSVLR